MNDPPDLLSSSALFSMGIGIDEECMRTVKVRLGAEAEERGGHVGAQTTSKPYSVKEA